MISEELNEELGGKVEAEGNGILSTEFTNLDKSIKVGGNEETSGVNVISAFQKVHVHIKMFHGELGGGTNVGTESALLVVNDNSAGTSGLIALSELAFDTAVL